MSDLIERLRDKKFWYTPHGKNRPMCHSVAEMAADYIERSQHRQKISDEIIEVRGNEIERLTQVIDDAYTAATTGDMVCRWYRVMKVIEDWRAEK